jgi:hypothetical protein
MRRPIPTDFDGTIDEIAKNSVSGFTRAIATNGERSSVSAGLRYRRHPRRYRAGYFSIKILINWFISIRVISSIYQRIIAALTTAA